MDLRLWIEQAWFASGKEKMLISQQSYYILLFQYVLFNQIIPVTHDRCRDVFYAFIFSATS